MTTTLNSRMISSHKVVRLLMCIGVICSLTSPIISYAAIVDVSKNKPVQYTLLQPLPCVSGGNVTCPQGDGTLKEEVNFSDYIQYIFNLVIALSAVASVFMIVWGGLQYMTSDSIQKKSDGKATIKGALSGLVLVLCSLLILKTIDPRLVDIPSTLVKPLDIKVDTSLTRNLFKDIGDSAYGDNKKEISAFRARNAVLNDSLAGVKSETKSLASQIGALVAVDKNMSEKDALAACGAGGTGYGQIKDLCTQLSSKMNEERSLKGQISLNNSMASMTIEINKCTFSQGTTGVNTITKKDCLGKIEDTRTNSIEELKASGNVQLIQPVESYARYSSAMVDVYDSIQTNMKDSSVLAKTLIDGTEKFIQGTGAALGAIIVGGSTLGTGAVLGGIGGFAIGTTLSDGTLGALVNASKEADRVRTISDIQKKINEVEKNNLIKEPAILAQFKEVTKGLIISLGGKGDGTDHVIPEITQEEKNTNASRGAGAR